MTGLEKFKNIKSKLFTKFAHCGYFLGVRRTVELSKDLEQNGTNRSNHDGHKW